MICTFKNTQKNKNLKNENFDFAVLKGFKPKNVGFSNPFSSCGIYQDDGVGFIRL